MYLLINDGKVITYISETISYQSNGNALVDNGTLAIAAPLFSDVCEVDTVPSNVEPVKYCYDSTTGEFSLNPNYEEPEPTDHDILNTLLGVAE